ncbi:hypothetical protein SCUCBS95973_001319 [Sporothrix curviconia]|uniref:Apple domain-containing protein n=1 Tax=Sporothrix curviconia TaxID=1260050 RepID=A0ABP0AXT0_9PEZI
MHLPRGSRGSGRPVYPRQAPVSSAFVAAAAAANGGGGAGPAGGGPPGPGGAGRSGPGRGGKGHGLPPFGGKGGSGGSAAGGGGGGRGGRGGGSGGGSGGGDGSTGATGGAASSNACPQTNGTTIGSLQQFTLLCDSAVGGDTINSMATSTFDDCTVACASFHPKCEAVSFDGTTCTLKANLPASGAAATAASTKLNGGVAQFPAASSNCGTLGASVTQSSMNFNLFCDNIIDGADLKQSNAVTLQDCMDLCVSTSGCDAVSFDATYAAGFKNCYLKTAAGSTGALTPIGDTGIDTAVVGNAVVVADPSSASSSVAAAPATPSPPAATSTTNAGVITVAPPQPSIVTQTVVSVITSVIDSVSRTLATTEVITVPMLGGSTIATTGATATAGGIMTMTLTGDGNTILSTMPAMASSTSSAASASLVSTTDGPSNSRAWIAAPVVGSVAAVMVVAVMFVLWGRRRRSNGLSSPLSPAFLFNRFRGAGGGGGSGSGGGNSGFRNLSSADSDTAPSRTVLPFGNSWRTGGRDKRDDGHSYNNNNNNNRMSEKYSNNTAGVARRILDEQGGNGRSSRTATSFPKSVPLVIDTGLARNSSSKSGSTTKPTIVAVAVTTDAAERAVRDKGKETGSDAASSRESTTASAGTSTLSSGSGEKPVPSRDLTSQSERGKAVLRDSMNGLAQNRTTLDGIPIFLRE